MEPIRLTTQEFYLYSLLVHAAIGLLLGLIPLTIGFIKHQKRHAFFGFLACILGGAILGIFLSLPLAAIFSWLIFKASNSKPHIEENDNVDSPLS